MAGLSPEAKRLFLEIHEEYSEQVPTLQGPSEYTEHLLRLQQQLLSKERDTAEVRAEFERILNEHGA